MRLLHHPQTRRNKQHWLLWQPFVTPRTATLPRSPQNAFKAYVRSRDYCTTSKHIINMCLSVVRVAVEMANWMHVQNYVAKAEQTPDMGVGGRGFVWSGP